MQREAESTGESFKAVREHIEAYRPDAIALENVKGLLSEAPDSDHTDAEWISQARGAGTKVCSQIFWGALHESAIVGLPPQGGAGVFFVSRVVFIRVDVGVAGLSLVI